MKILLSVLTIGLASTMPAFAQSEAQATASADTEISATLSKSLDARKAKPGDPVTAKTDRDAKASDGSPIKRGSTLVGRVTQARGKSEANGTAASTLGIVFDKAITKEGREVPLNASIKALGSAEQEAQLVSDSIGPGGAATATRGSSGVIGGVTGTATGAVGAVGQTTRTTGTLGTTAAGAGSLVTRSPGAVGGLTSTGSLQSGSQGVFGLDGLNLISNASGAAQGSVISSASRSVRLDGGTRLLLSNTASAADSASAVSGSVQSESQGDATISK